ncbi:bifunctional methylenetetrahydrofolate dehydrogenase/methenyltetrahydrofolate cyclohydrolase FolD [bacterium]|nr:bifunctional methylenetetrahydrofolate dehydrogenase/methenyltetrahydrofolate cyclohydrolase FolD [bacterium]
MTAELMDGKSFAKEWNKETSILVEEFYVEHGKRPKLAAIIVGDDPASAIYVNSKEKACKKFGLESQVIKFEKDITNKVLLDKLKELNDDQDVNGILVQQPLPSHINLDMVVEAVDPYKDVDGFHPSNLGKLLIGKSSMIPCTPRGIIEILRRYDVQIKGKKAVVIGRSVIVGKPMAMLLLHEHATVTICHSRTENLPEVASSADILVSAIGKPAMVDGSYIKKDAVVIDVGINRVSKEDAWEELLKPGTITAADFEKKGYTLIGDVDFAEASQKARLITPVPGGVGPLTIAMLLRNTLDAAKIQMQIQQQSIFFDRSDDYKR